MFVIRSHSQSFRSPLTVLIDKQIEFEQIHCNANIVLPRTLSVVQGMDIHPHSRVKVPSVLVCNPGIIITITEEIDRLDPWCSTLDNGRIPLWLVREWSKLSNRLVKLSSYPNPSVCESSMSRMESGGERGGHWMNRYILHGLNSNEWRNGKWKYTRHPHIRTITQTPPSINPSRIRWVDCTVWWYGSGVKDVNRKLNED